MNASPEPLKKSMGRISDRVAQTRAGAGKFGSLLNALTSAAFVIGVDDEVLTWNAAAEEMFGAPTSDVLGRRFRDLPLSHGVRGLRTGIEEVKAQGAEVTLEDVAVEPIGEAAQATLRLAPLLDAEGRVSGVIVLVDDSRALRGRLAVLSSEHEALRAGYEASRQQQETTASELQVTNEELQAINAELRLHVQELEAAQRADQLKNNFLAMLAHELRNPLAPITNALYIIRRRAGNEAEIDRVLKIAERQVGHQARLLDDLLDVSRIVLGKIELRREPVDLVATVRQAVEAARIQVEARAHDLASDLPDEPLVIEGDATRLEQVVRNLLSNAVKYTNPGGRIALTLEREGGEAVLRVRDTGVGIAPEMLPRVFDLFAQADSSLARSQGGLGIGLTLARRLVEMHRGTIRARSDGPQKGSEFEVRLPVAPPRGTPRPEEGKAPPRTSRRILVIEDNADGRELLRLALEMEGHRVDDAADGRRGVEIASSTAPDVVLIDIGLPELDGYEVAGRIRKRLGAAVRLIALTGYGDPDARRRVREAGFDFHLVKPVTPEDLIRALASRGSA